MHRSPGIYHTAETSHRLKWAPCLQMTWIGTRSTSGWERERRDKGKKTHYLTMNIIFIRLRVGVQQNSREILHWLCWQYFPLWTQWTSEGVGSSEIKIKTIFCRILDSEYISIIFCSTKYVWFFEITLKTETWKWLCGVHFDCFGCNYSGLHSEREWVTETRNRHQGVREGRLISPFCKETPFPTKTHVSIFLGDIISFRILRVLWSWRNTNTSRCTIFPNLSETRYGSYVDLFVRQLCIFCILW